jgi:hypothetical protein
MKQTAIGDGYGAPTLRPLAEGIHPSAVTEITAHQPRYWGVAH